MPAGNGPPAAPNLGAPAKNPTVSTNLKAAKAKYGEDKVVVPKGGFQISPGAPNYLAEQLNHPVIAVHPQGNVVKTDKGPVFMPHKKTVKASPFRELTGQHEAAQPFPGRKR